MVDVDGICSLKHGEGEVCGLPVSLGAFASMKGISTFILDLLKIV